ncbi:MAG TPA: glycosyltransferase family 9 protein, partial [bacterium]|nr:glycosyltransferase family 9 protein [bacterium]
NFFSRAGLWFRLWFNSFDAVIDLHSYPFSTTTTLLSVFSGAPIRIGFWAAGDFREYSGVSERVFNRGTNAPSENLPEVQKSFLLIKQLFPQAKLDLSKTKLPSVSKETTASVKSFYAKAGIGARDKVLGIHPTLQKKDNRWSQEKYMELIKGLASVKDLKVIVVHGKGETTELERFQKLTIGFSNVFTLPNDDLFFILEAAKGFDGMVCNDSGIMHLCAWVTPLFAVFGPSNTKRWGPQNQNGIKHHVFQTKDGLCDSVKPGQVAHVVRKDLF